MKPQSGRSFFLAVVLTVLLAACGQSPSVTLSVDQSSAELMRGSETLVTVTLARNAGASADVILTVTGLPANVSASFSPATLSGDDLVSVLTLSATGAAAEGSYPLDVTGTGTGLTASAPLTLAVTSLTVTGRVRAQFGLPIAGASVESQGQTTTTAADGAFTLSGLSVPYDLSVWSVADAWVQIYEGLSSSSLLLSPVLGVPTAGTARSVGISGDLSGDAMPLSATQRVVVCVEAIDTSDSDMMGCSVVGTGGSFYSFAAQWWGSASRAVKVHAIQVEHDGTGFPVAYPGYASVNLTITDGSPATLNLDLGAALETTTVDVTIDAASVINSTLAAVQVGPSLAMLLLNVASPVTSHSLVMPVIEDATYTFVSSGNTGFDRVGWDAGVSGPTADVRVPDVPILVAPNDAASGITTESTFSATNTGGGAVTFVWVPVGGGNPSVSVTTMANAHALPDLSPYGLSIPPGASYSWQVITQLGDATEAGTNVASDYSSHAFLRLFSGSPGLLGPGSLGQSSSRTFTTAP